MIQSKFSIKDLENLSGVKAHTIRIWEKRYNLLDPNRTNTNIRTYNLEDLQKILNVSYLNTLGYKISAIANLANDEIEKEVGKNAQKENSNTQAIQELKVAMVNFDQHLFRQIYDKNIKALGFDGFFKEVITPFLYELGMLWHSKTITIAHEHFISYLIRQKLLIELESVQYQAKSALDKTYILFLPDNEMHDLGLLYLNYELLSRGYNTIYLGPSVTLDSLTFFKKLVANPVYITCITVHPTEKQLPSFLRKFNKKVADEAQFPLHILGTLTQKIKKEDLQSNQYIYKHMSEFVSTLQRSQTA